MNYYCLLVETGKEESFKKAAQKKLDDGEFGFSGKILLFRKIQKLVKRGKVYDEILFPGYLFLKTDEADVKKFGEFSKLKGFLKFLPERTKIDAVSGSDLQIVTELEQNKGFQGFVKAKFDLNDKLVIVDGKLAGVSGKIIDINRRNQKLNMSIMMENGIKVVNLTYYDVEKQDWSKEEEEYIDTHTK